MKRTGVPASFFATASTTSTTGPQVRLVQNFGVANVTTNGVVAASDSDTEYRKRGSSGGRLVVIRAAGAVASVGVSERGARAPTATLRERAKTSSAPSAWIFAPTGWATSQ